MTDDDLDRAIDVAVREMMRVESSADVRARGRPARLRRSEPRLFTWPRLVFAAASLLLLAFALLRAPKPTPVAEVATTPSVSHAERSRLRRHLATTPSSLAVAPGLSKYIRRIRTRGCGNQQVELAPTVPPLGPIEPLIVEPPRPPDIEPDAIRHRAIARIPDVRSNHYFPLRDRNKESHVEKSFRGCNDGHDVEPYRYSALEARQVDYAAAVQAPPAAPAAAVRPLPINRCENATATCQYQARSDHLDNRSAWFCSSPTEGRHHVPRRPRSWPPPTGAGVMSVPRSPAEGAATVTPAEAPAEC